MGVISMRSLKLPASATFSLGLVFILAGLGRFLMVPDTMDWFLRARGSEVMPFVYVIFILDQLSSGMLLLTIGLVSVYAAGGVRDRQQWASIVSLINSSLGTAGLFLLVGAVLGVVVQGAVASHSPLLIKIVVWLLLVLVSIVVILLLVSVGAYRSGRTIAVNDRTYLLSASPSVLLSHRPRDPEAE